ncbi:MAG TPA: hypothetical protein VGL45_10260 [Bradyrhizobium sp.]
MNWAWATSLDQIWRSPAFPMWLTLAAAGFFGFIVLITLLRADRSVANGALTVITLLAIGVAVAATLRGFGTAEGTGTADTRAPLQVNASLPALSCIDDLAGETVLTACEKVLYGSSESVAAAVSYTSARIGRLTALGDVTTANRNMTPQLAALRRSIERDRYGLVAYVLLVRDHCTPADCAAFRSLTDRTQVAANMEERIYDGLVTRYSPSWNAPTQAQAQAQLPAGAATMAPLAGFPPSLPTGRPTNAEFPTAASTPAVSIMNPEPVAARAPAAAAPAPAAPPAPHAVVAAKKPAAKPPAKPRTAAAPVQIVPAAPAAAPARPAPND